MVRQKSGIPTVKWNYDQSAVVAVLHLSEVCCSEHHISTHIHIPLLLWALFLCLRKASGVAGAGLLAISLGTRQTLSACACLVILWLERSLLAPRLVGWCSWEGCQYSNILVSILALNQACASMSKRRLGNQSYFRDSSLLYRR